MPVDTKPPLPLWLQADSCKMHLRGLPGVDGLAANGQPLLEHAQFFEPRQALESDNILVDLPLQFDLNFKS